jgi:hypothetical protein
MGVVPAYVPAAVVATGNGMPACCTKHGQLRTLAKKLQLISRPPGWSYALLLLGALPFLIVTMIMRKTVTAPAWPFCDDCVSARKKGVGIGLGVIALGLLSFAVPVAVAPDSSASGLFVLLAFVLLFAGLIVAARSGWRFQSGAEVSADGTYVQVRKAHPNFAQFSPAASAGQQGFGIRTGG